MKKIVVMLSFSLFVSGMLKAQVGGSFVYDGLSRSYTVYLPENYNQSETPPLLLALHGLTQTGVEMMQFSDFNSIADTGRFIVVYPDGFGNAWNVGFSGGSTADDVGFLSLLIDTLHQQYQVDLNRVYATGFSNGGFMSYRLACELGNRIVAIAPVAGTMTEGSYNSCQPTRKVPVLHIHGTNDFVVSYNGGFGNKSVDQVLSYWNNFNNCPAIPVIENLPDIVAEGSTVQQQTWAPCDDSTEVILLKVINGGHTWPGSTGTTGIGITNRDISASAEIWKFVSRFSFDENTGISLAEKQRLMVYPNPATEGLLVFEMPDHQKESELHIVSGEGKTMLTRRVPQNSIRITIDISGLIPGFYLARISGAGSSLTSKFVIR